MTEKTTEKAKEKSEILATIRLIAWLLFWGWIITTVIKEDGYFFKIKLGDPSEQIEEKKLDF